MSTDPPVLEQPPSTMQMIQPSGDELVEDALVPSEAKRRFSPIDVIGPLVVLCVFVGVWNFMHYWGLEHIFHKGDFLMPPWRNILYDSFVRTIPQPDGSTVVGVQRPAPEVLGDQDVISQRVLDRDE